MSIRFKVCCIRDREEAALAVTAGASALGLVSHMPSGPGIIDEATIASIADATPPGVASVLLTSLTRVEAIIEQARRCRVNTIQLCDRLAGGTLTELRGALPGVKLIPVIHVTGPEVIGAAREAADGADALLLDTGAPDAETRILGGTGRTHDWSVSREIVATVGIPVFLAGGLHPENVAEAVSRVRPFAVDVCSGLRDEDFRLVPARLDRFIRALA